MPGSPVLEHLDFSEMITVIQNLRFGKASSIDEIPAELLKAGLGPLA